MSRLLPALLLLLALLLPAPPSLAQVQTKAYAPENLRSLSRADQERVLGLEYSEQAGGRRIPDDQLDFYLDQINRSNWGFSRIRQDIATSLGGNGGWNPGPGTGGSVLCGSEDNRRRTCRTGFSGRASLSENLSKTRCVEGQNWGSGNGTVWVDRGCRGRFVAGGFGGGTGATINCGSVDNRYRECRTGFRQAVLSRKLSDARCTEGETWGQRNGTVWVDRGCRAEFTEAGFGSGNARVRCESVDNRYRECNTGFRGNAVLSRKLSDARCTEGESWGQQRNGSVWVDRGCRAEFAEGNGDWNPGGTGNYSVTCSSVNNRRASCAWNNRYGRPYVIQQLSSETCREGSTWGYAGNQIWVDGGCRARFGTR